MEAKTDAQKKVVTCLGHTAASDRALNTEFLVSASLFAAALFQVKRAPCSPEHGIQDPGHCSPSLAHPAGNTAWLSD